MLKTDKTYKPSNGKRISVMVALVMMVSSLTAAFAQANVGEWVSFDRYAAANGELAPRQKNEKRVVFIGNSIIEVWSHLRPEFFSRDNYIARGVGGQTTYNLLLRFRQDALNLDPTVVVIEIGANDIACNSCPYNEDLTFANIVTMVELCQAHGIKPVLCTVLPCDKYYWSSSENVPDKIESLNRRVKAYAEANTIPYADFYTPLVHPGDRALTATFTDDGAHPNAIGYAIMEPVIQKILKKM